MAETSRPWSGTTTGDAGPYSSDQWAAMYRDTLNANHADSGVLVGSGVAPDNGLTIVADSPASMNVIVKAGAALVHGVWYESSADTSVAIAPNASGNPRIDTIVLRKSWAAQTVRMALLTGTPAATPVPAALTQSDGVTWEVPLADIAVANGAVSLSNLNITQRQTGANVSSNIYMRNVQNRTGVTLQTGDLVIWDSANNEAVINPTTDIIGIKGLAGVWVGRTANLGYGTLLLKGAGWVRVDGAVSLRRPLIPSMTTVRSAAQIPFDLIGDVGAGARLIGSIGAFATTLRSTSGAGLCWCYVDVNVPRRNAASSAETDNGANFTTTSAAFVTIPGVAISIIPSGSKYLKIQFQGNGEHSVAATLIHFDFQLTSPTMGTVQASSVLGTGTTFNNGLRTVRGLGAGLPVPFDVMCVLEAETAPGLLRPNEQLDILLLWRTAAATASLYSGAGGAANDVPTIIVAHELG